MRLLNEGFDVRIILAAEIVISGERKIVPISEIKNQIFQLTFEQMKHEIQFSNLSPNTKNILTGD